MHSHKVNWTKSSKENTLWRVSICFFSQTTIVTRCILWEYWQSPTGIRAAHLGKYANAARRCYGIRANTIRCKTASTFDETTGTTSEHSEHTKNRQRNDEINLLVLKSTWKRKRIFWFFVLLEIVFI